MDTNDLEDYKKVMESIKEAFEEDRKNREKGDRFKYNTLGRYHFRDGELLTFKSWEELKKENSNKYGV